MYEGSVSKYLLHIYYVRGTITKLDTTNVIIVNKVSVISALTALTLWQGKQTLHL